MSKIWLPLLVASLVSFGPALAEGKVPLPLELHINEQLVAASAGDMLRKTCPTIKAQTFTVLARLLDLKSYARGQGYTQDEVSLFLTDRSQKARIKATAADYLAKAGVTPADVDSFCRVGRNEIASGTLVGSLLRSTQ